MSCSFAIASDDQSPIDLYMFEQNIDGSNGEQGPSANNTEGAKFVGSFKLYNTTSQQYQAINISLFGVREAKFSIHNRGGQTMDADFAVTLEGLSLYAK